MNIAFFGTSDKSIPILEALKNSQYNLNLCVTKKDVKVGRHQKLKSTAVKKWAEENRVQIITTDSEKIKSKGSILDTLKSNEIELILVADFAFMIPEEIFNFPTYKTINIHFSLLPNYRGSSPVQFAIKNGDNITGISYILMSKNLDAGSIIYQSEYEISKTDTTESLYNKLFEKAANEIETVITKYINGEYNPKPQDETLATYTYSPSRPKSTLIFKEDAEINWDSSPQSIHNTVRAFYPWPIAWTTLKEINDNVVEIKPDKDLNKRVMIYKTRIDNGSLEIESLKVSGKQKIFWDDFKNGYVA